MDRRLEILSLKKAVRFTVNESQQTLRGNSVEKYAKLKSEIGDLWFFFKQVIDREKYGRQAIRLIQVLSYFGGTEEISSGCVDWHCDRSADYDFRSTEIFSVLVLLESYGVIQVEVPEEMDSFSIPNDFWMSVVREKNGKNPYLEIELLRTCLEMMKEGFYDFTTKNDHFRALSPHLLKHRELVKQCKKEFLRHHWNEQFTADILGKFEEVFGQLDDDTMELRFRHLKMMLESKENENKILLEKCEVVRVIARKWGDNYRRGIWSGDIAELIYDIGSKSQDTESRKMFYEETLHWHTMIHARLRAESHYSEGFVKWTLNLLIQLDRSEDVYNLFRELRTDYLSKERIINEASQFHPGFDSILSSMIKLILELKNPTIRTHLIKKILKISKFAFKIVLNAQKIYVKLKQMKICAKFPNSVKNYIKCLVESDQFDQILSVIQETDLVWQESMPLLTDRNWKVRECAKDYVNVHKLILEICIENQVLKNNVKLRNLFLKLSVGAIMPMCVSSPSTVRLLNFPDYHSSCMCVVGRCLIELEELNELIIFMNNLENLLDYRPENKESKNYNFKLQTSEGMINFCEMIVNCLTPLNGRVDHLQVLEKTLKITKEFLSVGRSEGLSPNYEETALNIIEVCDSNLKH